VWRTSSAAIKLTKISILSSRKVHVSWLVAWAGVGVLLGTVGSLFFSGFTGIEWIVVSVCLGVIGSKNRTYLGVLLVLIAGLLLGLYKGGVELQLQQGYDKYINEIVIASGTVSEDPTYNTDGDLRLKLKNIEIEGENVAGILWVGTDNTLQIKRSDKLEVEGKLTEGFGNIPAAIFRARVLAVERQDFSDVGRDTRDWFAEGIRESIREPEASLGAGFLLGQKTVLPEKLDNELKLLGLTHIVVASGYNLTILIRFSRRFLERISRFTALAGSFALVYGFLQITGSSPSMSRASLIAGISLLSWYYGRKLHPLVLLSFSASITVLVNPSYAWGDIGWLLSFTSFIGVIMLAPLLQSYFWGSDKPGNIRQVFVETLSAQLLTLPIIAYVFGQYSPLAIVANVLILPLIPIAMALTAVAGLAGVILPVGQQIIGIPAEFVLRYMTSVVNYLAQLPLASAEVVFTFTTVIISYIAIFTAMLHMWRKTDYQFRSYNVIE
jgi:competence protein ComEC